MDIVVAILLIGGFALAYSIGRTDGEKAAQKKLQAREDLLSAHERAHRTAPE